MLGLRRWGLGIAGAALAICTLALAFTDGTTPTSSRVGVAGRAFGSRGPVWWRVVTPDWVRLPADEYADRLLEALDALRRDQPASEVDAG